MKRQQHIVIVVFPITIVCNGQRFEKIILPELDTTDLYINDGESKELYYLKLFDLN
ncbi:MAG: hypothetical protein WBG90_22045 [Saonia sp.]